MKTWLKWTIGIFGIIILFGAIGSLFEDETGNTNQKIGSTTKDGVIMLGADTSENSKNINPIDLLPTNEEIDTEWENIERDNKIIGASGFDSGAYLEMDLMESLSLSLAYIHIYKFNSNNGADSFYSAKINEKKEERGYKETSTNGIDATCFGYKGGDLYEGYYYVFYCKKDNIFFLTEVDTFNVLRSGYAKDLAKMVADY